MEGYGMKRIHLYDIYFTMISAMHYIFTAYFAEEEKGVELAKMLNQLF